jgi:hypothetical protein
LTLGLDAELAGAQDRQDPRDLTALLHRGRSRRDLIRVLAEVEPEQLVARPDQRLPQLCVGLIAQLHS